MPGHGRPAVGALQAIEEECRRHRSDDASIEWAVYPVEIEQQTTGAVGVFRDITERRRAIQGLADSERRYRALYDNAPLGVLTIARDGSITEANDAGLEATGYALDDVRGRKLGEFVHPDERKKAGGLFRKVLQGERQEETLRMAHKDGSYKRARAVCIPIERSGEVIGMHGMWWYIRDDPPRPYP